MALGSEDCSVLGGAVVLGGRGVGCGGVGEDDSGAEVDGG